MSLESTSKISIKIFRDSIDKYHILDQVDQPFENPYSSDALEHLLFRKNWIDTVQWHYEDLIRDPIIDPLEGMKLKRLIDASNQERTDTVEHIDSFFLNHYKNVEPLQNATLNSEIPEIKKLCTKGFVSYNLFLRVVYKLQFFPSFPFSLFHCIHRSDPSLNRDIPKL